MKIDRISQIFGMDLQKVSGSGKGPEKTDKPSKADSVSLSKKQGYRRIAIVSDQIYVSIPIEIAGNKSFASRWIAARLAKFETLCLPALSNTRQNEQQENKTKRSAKQKLTWHNFAKKLKKT